jgi:hypothetical protein
MDGNSRIEIDHREKNNDLNRANAIITFSVARSDEVRMIQLRSTGPDHNRNNSIAFSAFAIFGSVVE